MHSGLVLDGCGERAREICGINMNNKTKDLCKAVDALLDQDWYAALKSMPDHETAPYLGVLADLEKARQAIGDYDE